MDQLPPPPAPRPDLPGAPFPLPSIGGGRPPRPQLVTAAGVILTVLGALGIAGGLILLALDPADLSGFSTVNLERVARGIGVLAMAFGGFEVLAGVLVLRLSNAGRILGLVLSCLGVVGGVGSLGDGAVVGLLSLGLYGLTVYALFAHRDVFERSGGR
jgi:hypothetical protein